MMRTFSLLLAMSAIVGFSAPAFASGATGLTENGALIPAGSRIQYTTVGAVKVTSTKLGTIECAKGLTTLEVLVNTLSRVVAVGVSGRSTLSTCSRAGAPVSVNNVNVSEEETTGGGTGKISLSFEIELSPGGTICKFTGTNDTFTYNPSETTEGSPLITLSSAALSVTPVACGTTASFDGVFTRETDGTTTHVFLM